jgi:hypothetical protein
MPSSQRKPRLFARTFQYAIVSAIGAVAAIADQIGPKPRPLNFTPVPSSLLLVVVGMIGLLGWNWWRNRLLKNRGRKELGGRD